ncbi:MAG: protein translocase SEC61 complex subunit gamma [Nanoarchaeota archaeon]|nr:protein translocase SEC61 complex subunit gamma [Nanoarchaeota archaeon]MCG2717805.1 protein translocase SEC61 complex subunit gamma [Nanoarchaeota archaeon]
MKKYFVKLKSFGLECRRVLRVTKKPNSNEFKVIVKVTGIGIMVIGFIGFVVYIAGDLIR